MTSFAEMKAKREAKAEWDKLTPAELLTKYTAIRDRVRFADVDALPEPSVDNILNNNIATPWTHLTSEKEREFFDYVHEKYNTAYQVELIAKLERAIGTDPNRR